MYLVIGRSDGSPGKYPLNLILIEVGDADGLDKSRLNQRLHGQPSLQDVHVRVKELAILVFREEVVAFLQETRLD